MKKIFVFTFIFTIMLSNIWADDDPYSIYNSWNIYKIHIRNTEDIYSIDTMQNIFVIDRTYNSITVHAWEEVIQDLVKKGYKAKYLRHLRSPDFDRASYHSWDSVQTEIAYYVGNHSNIAKCDTIGWSVLNKPILSVKISDNVGNDEFEGKIQFNGCHHGDENIATEINLYFMRYLLDNYGINSEVDSLIHNREIFLIPVVNPDGFSSNNRYNAHGIDLNRDYGFAWFQTSGATIPFSEPESRAMRDNYIEYCYTISLDYHSVSTYVNFLWDYAPYQIPDYTEEVVLFSVPYADSTGYDTINGYGWYQACGSCQDASYGLFGALDVTIESQQPSDPGPECQRNLGAMIMVAKLSGYGIAGYVTDSISGDPLEAVLFFKQGSNKRWIMNSRLVNGEYHKILVSGNYDVTAHVPGYISKTLSVQIYQDTFTQLNFQLTPCSSNYMGVRLLAARQERTTPFINNTYAFDALGPPDGEFMSLNQLGWVILDMGINTPITDLSGYDVFIYEGNDGNTEGAVVYAGNSPEWDATWTLLGTATGTDSFDLSASGLSQVRYLKIEDDYGTTSGSTPGYDLDAVLSKGPSTIALLDMTGYRFEPINLPTAGDSVDLILYLTNNGAGSAINTQADITSSSSYLTIIDSHSEFGTINQNDTLSNLQNKMTVEISASAPYGENIPIAIEFTADGGIIAYDTIEIFIGAEIFSDSIENGVGSWSYTSLWHISSYRSNSPTHSWYCGEETTHQYTNNITALLTTPTITLPGNSILSFYQWYEIESGWDSGFIEVSSNAGSTWNVLSTISGTATNWNEVSFDISSYPAGSNFQVRFRFESDNSVTEEGWYIDDIYVGPVFSVEEEKIKNNNTISYSINNIISMNGPSINFSLPITTNVSFSIFDITGRKLLDYNNRYQSGNYSWTWDRRIDNNQVASGVYFLRADFKDEQKTFKFEIID